MKIDVKSYKIVHLKACSHIGAIVAGDSETCGISTVNIYIYKYIKIFICWIFYNAVLHLQDMLIKKYNTIN